MNPATLVDVFIRGVGENRRHDRFLQKIQGTYRPIPGDEFARRVRACAGALASLGVARGDRVAILSYNRSEWAIADYACHLLGAASVPIYTTLPGEACAYILQDSGAKAAFVENGIQLKKLEGKLPYLISFEPVPGALGFDEFLRKGTPVTAAPVGPEDLATLIYTSGTTGTPKGVMLTHRNLVSNLLACGEVLRIRRQDTALSFLPLSHVFERLLDYALFWGGARIAYAEHVDKVADNLIEVRPTILAAVPRFYEKVHVRILEAVRKMHPRRRRIFEWARSVGALEAELRRLGRRIPFGLRWRFRLARWLVLGKLAARVGGRIRIFISGGAPLSPQIAEFFFSIGFTVLEGYGLTETSPVLAVNRPGAVKLGTVGPPIPGVEIRIAPDGEILARGPNVMKGYWNKPDETAEVLKDGWFHTGDIGEIDPEGYLRITDRKKDLLKTSGGKYVAPQPIETRLKESPHVANALVIGDRRKFPSALIFPAPGASRRQVQDAVDAVNASLAPYERIKKFDLLERDFSIEEGELTPTMKARRRVIEKKYQERIDALYAEENA